MFKLAVGCGLGKAASSCGEEESLGAGQASLSWPMSVGPVQVPLPPLQGRKLVPLVTLLVNVMAGGVRLSHWNQIVFLGQYSAQIVSAPRKYLNHPTLN